MNNAILADSCSELCYVRSAVSSQTLVRERWIRGDISTVGVAVVTDEQTAGRGRFGHRWEAPAGSSLLASVVCALPDVPASHDSLSWLTVCGALSARWALIRTLSKFIDVDELSEHFLLKWPNDLVTVKATASHSASVPSLAPIRKVSGVLGEYLGKRDGYIWSAIGVGINIWQSCEELPTPRATSLIVEYPSLVQCMEKAQLRDALLLEYRSSLMRFNQDLAANPDDAISRIAALANSALMQPLCAILPDGSLKISYGERVHHYHPHDVAMLAEIELGNTGNTDGVAGAASTGEASASGACDCSAAGMGDVGVVSADKASAASLVQPM